MEGRGEWRSVRVRRSLNWLNRTLPECGKPSAQCNAERQRDRPTCNARYRARGGELRKENIGERKSKQHRRRDPRMRRAEALGREARHEQCKACEADGKQPGIGVRPSACSLRNCSWLNGTCSPSTEIRFKKQGSEPQHDQTKHPNKEPQPRPKKPWIWWWCGLGLHGAGRRIFDQLVCMRQCAASRRPTRRQHLRPANRRVQDEPARGFNLPRPAA
jgi:hypothetical protein